MEVKMESNGPPSVARRLWHIVQVVYYMVRKGIIKRKLMMDLHVLLKRGKIAGKALGNLITFHSHHHSHSSGDGGGFFSAFSCHYVDPSTSFYAPREIEFSCSNTPAYPFVRATKKSRRRHHKYDYYKYDMATIAKAFEILNEIPDIEATIALPSPMPAWCYGRSPAAVRQLRVTDSPFPITEEQGEEDCHVDQEAEEFIKRFYEQLRRQQLMPATPEVQYVRREPLRGWA